MMGWDVGVNRRHCGSLPVRWDASSGKRPEGKGSMALVRVLEIENFRAVKTLRWLPGPGVNCLIGPGDSGKSTILDAIDLCLGARRSLSFTDADFHGLDFGQPIRIAVTLGALDDPLKNIDAYGDFLVGFNAATGLVEPEPGAGLETALTLQLTVQSDLEPEWTLVSPRAQAQVAPAISTGQIARVSLPPGLASPATCT